MDKHTFFVIDHAHIATIEEATAAEAIEQQNWLDDPMPKSHLLACPEPRLLEDLIRSYGIDHIIPIGSVEFITRFCEEHGVTVPQAINIPPELDVPRFLQRAIWRNMSKEAVMALPGEKRYLIKPGKTIKRFETTAYTSGTGSLEALPDDEPLFISERIEEPFLAEWRLFLKRGVIQDAKPYYFKQWAVPNARFCKEMSERLKEYPAMTLDVAVLSSGATIAIEAHTFLACGLYGFEGPEFLTMSKLAWAAQCKE